MVCHSATDTLLKRFQHVEDCLFKMSLPVIELQREMVITASLFNTKSSVVYSSIHAAEREDNTFIMIHKFPVTAHLFFSSAPDLLCVHK